MFKIKNFITVRQRFSMKLTTMPTPWKTFHLNTLIIQHRYLAVIIYMPQEKAERI